MDVTTSDPTPWPADLVITHPCGARIQNIKLTDVVLLSDGEHAGMYQGICSECSGPFLIDVRPTA